MPLIRLSMAVLALAVAIVMATGGAVGAAAGNDVVLGKQHLLMYGRGWGTPHPRLVDNGGVPSGRAFDLRWSNWGAPVARARGSTWIYKPHGGYYRKPGALEFRAYRLGHCVAGGPTAYTRLQARVAVKPGGRLTRWFAWAGWRSICRGP